MATLAAISLIVLLLFAAEQALAVAIFVRYCIKHRGVANEAEPSVLVVLPIRGADETLAACVAGLAQQEYESYRVRIIFDSDSDPGWEIADRTLDEYPGAPVEMMRLSQPHRHCSLKCSAVYEATDELDDAEVVAFLDSDVVPHESWLRELVSPFADARVGATNGNRWYLPTGSLWGSLVRYCWNSATVVTMQLWNMPWGGTMAIRREVLEQTDIRQRWLKAGCEDVPIASAVRELGQRVQFVPHLLMKDRQEVTLDRCLPFLDRQLLWARLYYPACWWVCSLWQLFIVVAMVLAGVAALGGAFLGDWNAVWLGLAAQFVMPLAGLPLTLWLEKTLLPDEETPASRNWLLTLGAIVLTNLLMVRVIVSSLLTRSIDWRGITYRIRGAWDVEMQEYRTYDSANSPNKAPATRSSSASELAEIVTH